jgi:hypothetical protein
MVLLWREFFLDKELEGIIIKLIDPIVAEQISQTHDSLFKTKQQQFQELEQKNETEALQSFKARLKVLIK